MQLNIARADCRENTGTCNNERTGLLRSEFTATERNLLLQQGEENIRNDVPNLGILEDARKNTEMFFTTVLKQLGYTAITIKFAEV